MRRAAGSFFGLAIGDAIAAPTEFLDTVAEIRAAFPPAGPQAPDGDPALVTDDTQMALAVADALQAGGDLAAELARTFVAWSKSPDNNRYPGGTCLRACARLAEGRSWLDATQVGSKGCGANMRVAPVALDPHVTDVAAVAQLQAAVTHGHPTALAASDLTARAIVDLKTGGDPSSLVARLVDWARSQRTVYHQELLGDLWRRAGASSPAAYIASGWDECLGVLARVDPAKLGDDPCALTGAGWIAEEAFATGLVCFLASPDDAVAGVRRAAVTSGDSDSIACLTGAFAGARLGIEAWPADWVRRIEYRERIDAHARRWDALE